MQLIKYLRSQLDQLSYDKETGIAYGSVRLAARMAGVDHMAITVALEGGETATTKLAEYLTSRGFRGGETVTKQGIPADVITAICTYYALKAGRWCNDTAGESLEMFAQIGLTVAIKQSIGVAVDDRPAPTPAVVLDFSELMGMLIQQQAQINALLAGQVQTTTQRVVKRTGVAAEVQALRCEANQIWQNDGQRDPNGAKRRMALLDAQAEQLLHEAGIAGGYSKQARVAIGTGTYYNGMEIFKPMPLAEEDMIQPFRVSAKAHDRQPRLKLESRVRIQAAVEKVLEGFNADLLHGGYLYHAIFSVAALDYAKEVEYDPHRVLGYALKHCGFARVTQHNRKGPFDCPNGHKTYSVYGRTSVYPDGIYSGVQNAYR